MIDTTGAVWRKSGRSGANGGACVEIAAVDLDRATWRKSSRSSGNGGACVEVAPIERAVAVRDSKNPDGPKLAFTPAAWRTFTRTLR